MKDTVHKLMPLGEKFAGSFSLQYLQFKPELLLSKYIEFYWVLQTGTGYLPQEIPLFASGCTDLFVNSGNAPADFNGHSSLLPGRLYIGGASTASYTVRSLPGSSFAGIRFKPAGLSAFYKIPMFEIVDRIFEFKDDGLSSIVDLDEALPRRLDHHFLEKLNTAVSIQPVTELVQQYKGLISVDELARQSNSGKRTLERKFLLQLGIGPKEFINIVRFQHALNFLQSKYAKGKLLDIACETGYHDHAHLSRDVKKYSGLTPSGIWPVPKFL